MIPGGSVYGLLVKGKGRSKGLVCSVRAPRLFLVPEEVQKGGRKGRKGSKESRPRAEGLSGHTWNASRRSQNFEERNHAHGWTRSPHSCLVRVFPVLCVRLPFQILA